MNMRLILLILIAVAIGMAVARHRVPAPADTSRVGDGNLYRLQNVLGKARQGQPITLGFLGGSITAGEKATLPDRSFARLVGRWWNRNFSASGPTIINAGVPGTGSAMGVLRLQRDLLGAHPDLVVVEFGVNDRDDRVHAETYEGIIRQLLESPHPPAIVLLFMMHHDGTNAQDFQSRLGEHYQLPMISFRDAVWPAIAAGRVQVSDVLADTVHPNDRGHAEVARELCALFSDCSKNSESAPPGLSAALFTDVYDHTKLVEAEHLQPTLNDGWRFDLTQKVWKSQTPGSTIHFMMRGRLFSTLR